MTFQEWSDFFYSDAGEELIQYVGFIQQLKEYRSPALALRDISRAGKSRMEQLRRYGEKRKNPSATFRPYAPLKLSESKRGDTKRAAAIEGVATKKELMPWRCQFRGYDESKRCRLLLGHDGSHDFST